MIRRQPSAYLGIFFVAGSIILFEIAMTRVFAIMMWHHFTYLVISIALLGFGAAGSILTATRASLRTTSPARELAGWSTAYAVALIAAFFVTTRIRIDSLEIWHDKTNFLTLFLIYVVLSVPLLLGGLAVGLALARLSDRVNKLYCADLLGSAAGAAASVWILESFGNTTAIMSAGAVGLLGALLFACGAPARSRILPAALLAASLFLVAGFARGSLEWVIPYAPGKDVHGLKTDIRLPSATAEVEVTEPHHTPPGIGGDFGGPHVGPVDLRVVLQDGTAPTALFKNAANIASHEFLDDCQAGSAYVCRRAAGGSAPNVLVIGVGGGVDIMIALAHGASHVTGVEINRAMIDMSTKAFPAYTGGWLVKGGYPDSARVDLVHSEGRSYVRRRDDRYDLIQMSGVDTFTALSTGAYTLSESYLYTVEAVKEFYEHLNDGGFVCYSRLILSYPRPRETLRLANIAVTALEDLGVPDAASHVCVFQGVQWASTMIKRGPFTAEEIRALERFALDEGFFGLVFDPLAPPEAPYGPSPRTLASHIEELRGFVRKHIAPPGTAVSDREADALVLRVWGLVSARVAGDEAALLSDRKALTDSVPAAWRDRASAAISGFLDEAARVAKAENEHFHSVRRDFASLLRGDRAKRTRFAADYPYDISPCRDDRPFYFNYYKYSGLFRSGTERGQLWANPDFPIGHLVLVASLVQIVLLAIVLIILPIRRLARRGMQAEGKLGYLAYFSALGLGFMSIEIVMMQKMVLFLGHPTHALSVVLTALLASTGLGSLLSARLPVRPRSFAFVFGAILVTSIGALLVVNHAFPLLLGRPLPERVCWVIAVLTPLGTALGMAFPTGIRLVRERAPALIPWCWAINGITSVFATIFCIMVALEVGFSVVVILAAAIYFAGTVAVLRIAGRPPEPRPIAEL